MSELEEKYKKAMMSTAQLDNEKQTYRYQVELLKDQLEELEEQCIELQRINKDTNKVSALPFNRTGGSDARILAGFMF